MRAPTTSIQTTGRFVSEYTGVGLYRYSIVDACTCGFLIRIMLFADVHNVYVRESWVSFDSMQGFYLDLPSQQQNFIN